MALAETAVSVARARFVHAHPADLLEGLGVARRPGDAADHAVHLLLRIIFDHFFRRSRFREYFVKFCQLFRGYFMLRHNKTHLLKRFFIIFSVIRNT
ncbi:hypothetical protein SDC9_145500 [bioreactor metagenome]|uniref:Uncharacterized protein n=1 Tax=bioreactor metagenome TaxID=1076179 RepID=A0A645EA20_9ZZZZ